GKKVRRLWLHLWTWSAKSKFPSSFTPTQLWREILGKLFQSWAHRRPFYSNTMMQAYSGCLNEAACMMMF
ncbi:hypothetical protein CWN49_33385, partial [Klebsiella michiganensis]